MPCAGQKEVTPNRNPHTAPAGKRCPVFRGHCFSPIVPPFDNSLYLPTARFARNGGVDAKDFQRLWREMEKAPASTTPYGEGTSLGAGDGRTNEGPQGSRRDAADGRIGGDKVFEVKFRRKTSPQALGLCNDSLCRVANSFDVWSGDGRNATRSWVRNISFACTK